MSRRTNESAIRPDLNGQGNQPDRRTRRGQRGEQSMVPSAEFRSYYGRPIIKKPVWQAPDVPGYLFLGGLAGASSALAASAELSGRPELARISKVAAAGAIGLSMVALIRDLGRPARFHHMLRVFKPTSPMSVGSWLLAGYGPAAGVAGATAVTGLLPRTGQAATAVAAVLGPGVAAYTAALLSDTAVPAWHDAHRELPYLFVSSAATAAGGLTAAALSGRSRAVAALAGTALVASSALTRFGVFFAGVESARDPKYTVAPQRARLRNKAA